MQNVEWSLGYMVVIKRTKPKLSGYVLIVILMCYQGGVFRVIETSTRDMWTRKTNCSFELFVCYYKVDDVWRLKIKNDQDNYEPAVYMEGHPFIRQLTRYESQIVAKFRKNNVLPYNILSMLNSQNDNNISTIKTIYNVESGKQSSNIKCWLYSKLKHRNNRQYVKDLWVFLLFILLLFINQIIMIMNNE